MNAIVGLMFGAVLLLLAVWFAVTGSGIRLLQFYAENSFVQFLSIGAVLFLFLAFAYLTRRS